MGDHVLDFAESYWRGELDPSQQRVVAAHLAQCDECRLTYDAIGAAIKEVLPWAEAPAISLELERRIIDARPGKVAPWWRFVAAAGIVAVLAGFGGYAAGRASVVTERAVTAPSSLHTFILLLEEPEWPPVDSLRTSRDGYSAWVQDLRTVGRYVTASKLTEEPGIRIGVDGVARTPTTPNLSGWYLLRAKDYDEAVTLARRGPHLRYGSILVRQVE